MLADGHYVLRSAFIKDVSPFVRVEFIGVKTLDYLSVIAVFAEIFYSPLPAFRVLLIHLTGEPLALDGGNAVTSPVNEQTETVVFVPVGNFVLRQTLAITSSTFSKYSSIDIIKSSPYVCFF